MAEPVGIDTAALLFGFFWFSSQRITVGTMHGTASNGDALPEPGDELTFPTPSTSLSLRHLIAYRGLDDDGEPILIITDGVSSIALESGLAGPSSEVVVAARRLAATAEDFAAVLAEHLPDATEPRPGRRPLNRRYVPGPRGGTP